MRAVRAVSWRMHAWRALVLAAFSSSASASPQATSGASAHHAAPPPSTAPNAAAFDGWFRPWFGEHCVTCHGAKKAEQGLDLTRLGSPSPANEATWQAIWQRLDRHEMPPQGEPQPSEVTRRLATSSIESMVARVGPGGKRDPGRPVVRRLNRTEYKNTIRDLLGVEAPTDDFPQDDVGYGFDNIGDVLSLPPLLLEKYLAAATKILDRAITTPSSLPTPIEHVSGRDLSVTLGGVVASDPPTLFTNAELYTYFQAPKDGRYLLRVRAAADPSGDEPARGEQAAPLTPAKVSVQIDGNKTRTIDVVAPRGNPGSYEVELTLTAGLRRIGLAFTNATPPPLGVGKSRNLIVHFLEVDGPLQPRFDELPRSHRQLFVSLPSARKAPRDAAREVLSAFVDRAFRRPARGDEVSRYLALFDLASRETFEKAMKVPLAAILVSPQFLFHIETNEDVPPRGAVSDVRLADDFALASRLSYFLWSSMPDAQLFAAAGAGELRTPEGLDAQIARMLADPKARALSENFAPQWLQTRRLRTVVPDAHLFPDFDDRLKDAMESEPVLFFDALLREERPVDTLLDADFTFLNERLARHYGISGIVGPEMRRATLRSGQRGGILTMASVLTATSTPARTSPVKRGKWVLEAVLGTPPPPPAPDVGALRENVGDAPKVSVRDRMEAHRKNPSCASCHARMDPIGFGLEHYDAIGAYREKDEGLPIDDEVNLPGGATLHGAPELRGWLSSRRDDFTRCLTEKMLTYALGRGLEFSDFITVREIDEAVAKNGNRLSALVRAVAESYPFRYQRGPVLAASRASSAKVKP